MFKPALLLYTSLVGAMAAAASLDDPTRPTRPGSSTTEATAPAEHTAARGPRWVLQSTLTASARRVAVINGAVVGEGDHVDGARVLEVRPGLVRLEARGRPFELYLPEARVKHYRAAR